MQSVTAWSNLTFVIVGLVIIFLNRQYKKTLTCWLGPIIILIGLSSFYHHSTYTEFTKMLDLGTIFLFSSLLIILGLRRYRPQIKISTLAWLYTVINLASWALMYIIHNAIGLNIGISILGIHVVFALAYETLIWLKAKAPYRLSWLLAALLIASIAANFWMMDFTKSWGNNHAFQWPNAHALWHFLTAFSLGFVYLYYKQFNNIDGQRLSKA